MEAFGRSIDGEDDAGVDFLFTEFESARAFLQTAAISQVEETRAQSRKHAQAAYQSILRYAPQVTLTGEQKQRFDALIAELRSLLVGAGIAL